MKPGLWIAPTTVEASGRCGSEIAPCEGVTFHVQLTVTGTIAQRSVGQP